MPSMYELSDYECAAIAHALMLWVKVRGKDESPLTDWQVLQIIATLGAEENIDLKRTH